jgi:hypothetical protein
MMFDAISPYSRHAVRSLTLVVFLMVMALTTSAALAAYPDDTQQLEELSAINQPETPEDDEQDDSIQSMQRSPNYCARVTASVLRVYRTARGNAVQCRFLRGDVFLYRDIYAGGTSRARLLTWCPRHTPPGDGYFSWAPMAGTEPTTCPW